MPDPFESALWKLRWALEDAKTAHDLTKPWLKLDPHALRSERDRQGRIVFRLAMEVPSPEIGRYIASSAHQMRCALDHIAWVFSTPAKKKEQKVSFPIFDKRTTFNSRVNEQLPNVPQPVRALVERLQPYHRRKWPETALLAQIRDIDNWDKHRTITTTTLAMPESYFTATATKLTIVREETFRGVLKPNTMVARYEVADLEPGAHVQVKSHVTIHPVFDKGMGKLEGLHTMRVLYDTVRFIIVEIVPRFRILL